MKSVSDMTIGFIGGGNMAEAIVKGVLGAGAVQPGQVVIADPSSNRRDVFNHYFKTRTTADNREVVEQSDVVVLAVKPQFMSDALTPVSDTFRPDQLVISIAAGIRTDLLDRLTGGTPSIVRVMPNTPALVGEGVTALCKGPRADDRHVSLADGLFSVVGSTLIVDEADLDAVTALSGSGPAYLFYLLEAMMAAARDEGFDDARARELVYGTVKGAISLAANTNDPPAVLRERVTSKGGTTAAALDVLNSRGVGDAVRSAIKAAANRSRELSASS
jgi:pyrroline-5-carboxylate reductase